MPNKRIEHVKEHFDSESAIFDNRVVKIVPYYKEMLDALISAIPYPDNSKIKVIDLGCGTGTITCLLKNRYPNARVECVDLAPNMLELSKKKLEGFSGINYVLSDFTSFKFIGKYDAIISSLALHHVEPDIRKIKLYKKIYKALKKNGVFINADIILASNHKTQDLYLKKWEDFILKSYTREQVDQNYKRHKNEDRPAILLEELKQLKRVGFLDIDVYWKYYNFAVYGGRKQTQSI